MAERSDILLELWRDARGQAYRANEQRAVFTNLVLLIAAADLGFIAERGLGTSTIPMTAPLIVVGLIGCVATLKYYERFQVHMARARRFNDLLSAEVGMLTYSEMLNLATKDHDERFGWRARIHLNHIWLALHITIALAGVTLTVLSVLM